MNDPPIHPDTGEPVTAEQLIAANDELDDVLNGDLAAIYMQVGALRKLLDRSRRQNRAIAAVAVAAIVFAAVGTFYAVRVDRNTREIDRTQEAIRVFCDETNRANRVARAKFLEQFADIAPDPKQLIQFADVNWPQRDCEQVSTVSDPSPSTTTMQGVIP